MNAVERDEALDGRCVVVVDPWSSGATLAPALRAAGFRPVAVVNPTVPRSIWASTFRPDDFDAVYRYEAPLDAFAARLSALDPSHVLAGAESGVELADALAAILTPALANVPALTAARRDKALMGEAVAAAGLPHIRQICTDDVEAVAAWISANELSGSSLVVKPPKSSGTDGVVKVDAGGDWRGAFLHLLGRRNQLGGIDDRVLVQEFAEGEEYVVNTFTTGGRHTVTDICRYQKPRSAEQFAIYEAMDFLPYEGEAQRQLVPYAFAVLDALGIRFGPAHMELMLTADGPRLIEVGARMCGSIHYPHFGRTATGESQLERIVRSCGGDGDIRADYVLRRHLRVTFLVARTCGVVRNAEVFDRLPGLASYHVGDLHVANGAWVPKTTDLFTALGMVSLAHPDPAQVLADYATIRAWEADLVIEDPDAEWALAGVAS